MEKTDNKNNSQEEIQDNDYKWRVIGGISLFLFFGIAIVCVIVFSRALTAKTIVVLFGMFFSTSIAIILLVLRRQTKVITKFSLGNALYDLLISIFGGIIVSIIGIYLIK